MYDSSPLFYLAQQARSSAAMSHQPWFCLRQQKQETEPNEGVVGSTSLSARSSFQYADTLTS